MQPSGNCVSLLHRIRPPSTELRDVPAKVLFLRAADDRRGRYAELRAFIDAAKDVEVAVERTA